MCAEPQHKNQLFIFIFILFIWHGLESGAADYILWLYSQTFQILISFSSENDSKIKSDFWIAAVLYSNVALLLLLFTWKGAQHNGRWVPSSDSRNKFLRFWYAEIVGPPWICLMMANKSLFHRKGILSSPSSWPCWWCWTSSGGSPASSTPHWGLFLTRMSGSLSPPLFLWGKFGYYPLIWKYY